MKPNHEVVVPNVYLEKIWSVSTLHAVDQRKSELVHFLIGTFKHSRKILSVIRYIYPLARWMEKLTRNYFTWKSPVVWKQRSYGFVKMEKVGSYASGTFGPTFITSTMNNYVRPALLVYAATSTSRTLLVHLWSSPWFPWRTEPIWRFAMPPVIL